MDETKLNWTDLKLFLAVARGGGLAGGAQLSGLSAPSLGRHMLHLERAVGEVLFLRHPRGYELTEAGKELLQDVQATEASVLAIEQRLLNQSVAMPVNISAGTWMTHFLTRHIAKIAQPDVRLIFCPDETHKHIGRREATIGLRNTRPKDPSVFIRRTARVAFSSFATAAGAETGRWIALDLATPSAHWVQSHKRDNIHLHVSNPRTLLDLALQDIGQIVLPCFIGDNEPGLIRTGGIIPALTHDQWLVVHGEEREFASTRSTADRIVQTIKRHRNLFEGDRAEIAN